MVQIKIGYSKVKEKGLKDFSFDNWLYEKLIDYGLAPTRTCCNSKQ